MTAPLTPEGVRAAADAYAAAFGSHWPVVGWFRAEADRLEAATRTPGQVASGLGLTDWIVLAPSVKATWESLAALVIDHVVGPDRVVMERVNVVRALAMFDPLGITSSVFAHLREALS